MCDLPDLSLSHAHLEIEVVSMVYITKHTNIKTGVLGHNEV